MRTFLLVALSSLIALSYGDDDMFALDKKSGRKHYCGKELRRNLMFLCDSIYKRSSSDGTSGHEDWVMNLIGMEDPQMIYPFRSRAKAFAVIPEYFRRQTRGVADECCSKPCTIDELSSYCGQRPS
ncbi:bombyxin A-3 homolog [Macrosteles quadrilineatus]|uniref:bombyxin A-3 homolog n=1 Tax=Macrosteles quadrilineatus TaxID=74068 RepID=UPI0023E2088D|nr:bombyxin A-3 homolog [Macrosteles quadrilineatus]XP_054263908.1 bombyxin A-3 homolog [Macrosteles quadrilineatus]